MTYAEKLKDPRWQKKRLEILKRDNFTCILCSDKETTLHVHHLSYGENPWDSKPKQLVTVCEHCHSVYEYYKKNVFSSYPVKVFKEKMKYETIIHVLSKSISGNIAVFSFTYDGNLVFLSGMLPDIIEAINKELRK